MVNKGDDALLESIGLGMKVPIPGARPYRRTNNPLEFISPVNVLCYFIVH